MRIMQEEEGFSLYLTNGKLLARHTKEQAFVRIGMEPELHDDFSYPEKSQEMEEQFALSYYKVDQDEGHWMIYLSNEPTFAESLCLSYDTHIPNTIKLTSNFPRKYFNRYWFRFASSREESLYGGGQRCQQFNIKNARHAFYLEDDLLAVGARSLPLRMVRQPGFISTQGYAFLLRQGERMSLNALYDDFFELETWGYPQEIFWIEANRLIDLLTEQNHYIGYNADIPKWALQEVVAGFKGPMRRIQNHMNYLSTLGFDLGGVWLQDFSRATFPTFGEPCDWNWYCAPNFQDALRTKAQAMAEHGVQCVGYLNALLLEGSLPFNEADGQEYLVNTRNGDVYFYKWNEFSVAMIDLTNPEAFSWFVEVIKKQLLDLGIRHWVIDDGSHLPVDAVLYNGELSYTMVNTWPELLARASHQAIVEAGLAGEVLVLATSAWLHSMRYIHGVVLARECIEVGAIWTLKPIFISLISGSMSGCGIQVSIIGNSTGAPANKELIIRHAEIVAFTACFWMQESDRRYQNFSYYKDKETMHLLLHLATLYEALAPYRAILLKEWQEQGLPFNRALFLYDEKDPVLRTIDDQMLLGKDLMIAPIFHGGQELRRVYFPKGSWHHMSSTLILEGPQWIDVESPLGRPIAFYRGNSAYFDLFEHIRLHFCSLIQRKSDA